MSTLRKRPPIVVFFAPAFFGLMALFSVMQGPGWTGLRFLDIVRLLTAGFGFGATVVGLIMALRWTKR